MLLSCLSVAGIAQVDTLLELPTVELAGSRLRTQTVGGRTQSWSQEAIRSQAHVNLSDWLGREAGLFIKSYGSGSIATTSIRGGSASHTAVLWNGMPVQSPMLGQLDFSLFPLAFVDRIAISFGGNSAAWGSGAIGGVVELENESPSDSTARLNWRSTLGSFAFQDHQLVTIYGNGRWGFSTRLFSRSADNDFPYRLQPDRPEQRQTNAALQQRGLLQSFYWKTARDQQWNLHFWAQGSDREVPPTTVQNQSLARQADELFRTQLHWKRVGSTIVWQARFGLFREVIDYRDEQILLRAKTGFWTALAEAEGNWAWKSNRQLRFGLNHRWTTAEAEAYDTTPEQNRTAAFVSYRQFSGPWRLQFNLREEVVDGILLPPVPGLGLEYQLSPLLSLRAKISRNYRLPTLNDRYWQPGGNPDLLPESGWSQEGGVELHHKSKSFYWSYQLTAFNRRIRNWILWSRPEGQAFWSSNNITEVWSRGLEQRMQWLWQRAAWRLRFSAGYDYTRSTNEIALTNPRLEAGVQLIYIPEHRAFGRLDFHWRHLRVYYRQHYTGPVQSINVGELPGYHLGNAGMDYELHFPAWSVQVFLHINNVWDKNYRVIERQPMPGRHFHFGIQLNLQKKHQHQ